MKHSNFINPASNKQIFSLVVWRASSLLLLIASILALSIVTVQKYVHLKSLRKEIKQRSIRVAMFDSVMKQKQDLKQKDDFLNNQLTFINTTRQNTHNYATLLQNVRKTLKKWAHLESLSLDTKKIGLCVDCTQTSHAMGIVTALAQLPSLGQLQMRSLQPKQQGTASAIRLTLQGVVQSS